MPSPLRLTLATRESKLALWQANHISERLRRLYPGCVVELLGITTEGDRKLDQSLAVIGGKGLFIKELEYALQQGKADFAVHSLKDVPMELSADFVLAAVTDREDPRDAFISHRYASFADMPEGSVVGTSSLRREVQIRARWPKLAIKPLRGNVDTRLSKLDQGQYDAIVLAAAGMRRLNLAERITAYLAPEDMLPAVGQGALAIECSSHREDLHALLSALNDAATASCVIAERAFSRALSGNCQTPLAAYATLHDGKLTLRGLVATRDGQKFWRAEKHGNHAEQLGQELAQDLLAQGAGLALR